MNQGRTGTIVAINISRGGVPKRPVLQTVVDAVGLAGDGHDHPQYHGGPDRAVCLWASEIIEALAREGHPIFPGAAGENVTTRGLDWALVVPGARLRLGDEVTIEITDFAVPCKANRPWFNDGDFKRMSQKKHPGQSRVYARVLTGGALRPGDAIVVL